MFFTQSEKYIKVYDKKPQFGIQCLNEKQIVTKLFSG